MRRSRRDKPKPITDALLRKWRLPDPAAEGSKEARGRALIIAGADEMPGAAILASTAALRAGAGKVRVATSEGAAMSVATAVPELFVLSIPPQRGREDALRAIVDSAKTADAVLIGPGMRDNNAIASLLPQLLEIDTLRALVIDASALPTAAELLPERGLPRCHVIITPHAAEIARMMKTPVHQVEADRLHLAREAAQRLHCVVALKAAKTVICTPDGEAYLNEGGNVGLATAGSGDVLAGILTGLCARGAEPLHGAVWGVAIHARAGERLAKKVGPIGYLAREIIDEVPALMAV